MKEVEIHAMSNIKDQRQWHKATDSDPKTVLYTLKSRNSTGIILRGPKGSTLKGPGTKFPMVCIYLIPLASRM